MPRDTFATAVQLLIQASQEGRPKHEAVLQVGQPVQVLVDAGFNSQRLITISGRTVDKAFFDHGITRGMLQRLPQLLEAPHSIYRSATLAGAVVVVTLELKNGEHVIVPIHMDKLVGRSQVHSVASIYAVPEERLRRWEQAGLLIWKARGAGT